jgi:phosphate transport system protein
MAAPTGRAARQQFDGELEQLRLQVELMAVRVDQNLERMHQVLVTGDVELAAEAIAADDEVDAMHLSLMERCYELLRREAPVASDLRFVVSVLRVLGELERIGDLSLRVHKLADRQPAISAHPAVLDVLISMTECAVDRYRLALRAWATVDLDLAAELAGSGGLDRFQLRLTTELLALHDADAVAVAMDAAAIGRAVDRISDHASIIGARLRYLITGDPDHLAAEVR